MKRYFLTTAILLFLCKFATSNLPEDLKSRWKTSEKESERYLVFKKPSSDYAHEDLDVQEVKFLTKDRVLVAVKNNFYIVDSSSLTSASITGEIPFSQRIKWKADNETIASCKQKLSDFKECNNYIRVVAQVSNSSVLLCGTNALSPQCRLYEWDNVGKFTGKYRVLVDEINTVASPVFRQVPLTYTFSDGNLYTGTHFAIRKKPMIIRRSIVEEMDVSWETGGGIINSRQPMPTTRSANEQDVFNRPRFVGSVDAGGKVFFFFREIAMEKYGGEETDYSRVAQVCKRDKGGGESLLNEKWTSFFKARLNCSVPGERPFYFNDIQHISDPLMLNGEETILATMTTPQNSIRGSAVCAFSVAEIERVFSGGFFNAGERSSSGICFGKSVQQAPSKHPTVCPTPDQDSRTYAQEDLNFRRTHVLMKNVVQPITGKPLFVETQTRHVITAVAGDKYIANKSSNITFMYMGTSNGRLLKVVSGIDEEGNKVSALAEEVFVYSSRKCSEGNKSNRHVLKVISVPDKNSVLVVFKDCIVSVPKHECPNYSCKTDCVQSGNPYCGWINDRCVKLDEEHLDGSYEQDLFAETKMETCQSQGDFEATSLGSCGSSFLTTIVPIIVCVCFTVLVVIAFAIYKLQRNPKLRRRHKHHVDSVPNNLSRKGSNLTVQNSSASLLRNNSSNKRIYTGPKNDIKRLSNASSLGRNPSFGRQAPSIPPPLPPNSVSPFEGDGAKTTNFPSEASYESLKSVTTFDNQRGRMGSETSNTSDNVRRFHGVNIVENIKSAKTSPPQPRHGSRESFGNTNNNNQVNVKLIGVATAMSRNESPVRRRCRSSQEEEFNDIFVGGNKCNKSNSLKNAKVSNRTAQYQNMEKQQKRSLPSPLTAEANGSIRSSTGTPMVAGYAVIQNNDNNTFNKTESEPDYANIVTPEKSQMKMPPPPPPTSAKPGRKLSSFTNAHFNTAWFPAAVPSNEDQTSTTDSSSGRASLSSGSSMSDHIHNNNIQITQRSVAPPRDLKLTRSNKTFDHSEKRFTPSTDYYNEVESNANSIPIHYEDDSAFFDGKQDSSDDGIMRDLDEIMRREGCKKHSMKKRKKMRKERKGSRATDTSSPSDSENRLATMIDKIHATGLPYVLSDEEHIYETPTNPFEASSLSQQSATDDFNVGQSNKRADNSSSSGNNYAFHTMRPPGRRRQKLPRLRNSEQKEEHKPLAVPTPVIPK